ncbi:diadenylate cyclase CdaM [Mycoplasmoides alvi]|uniref:diadenylate cyclase CdaM n=1 Tax=Mycoplasmoides alvi TaxID=78580 RepID=UPI00051B68F6|nr:diadenylate cyclase CdaM [Mycoplasmoides alvi]
MNNAEIFSLTILVLLIVAFLAFIIYFFSNKDSRNAFVVKFKKLFHKYNDASNDKKFIDNLSSSLLKLSSDKIGAIIAIEQNDALDFYINVGYKIQGDFSPEFIISVFYNKNSALHDGAIIVRDKNIVSISSYFPMTRQLLDVSYGARHRSAVGLSERTDSVIFVVSETSGRISAAKNGVIHRLSQNSDRLVDEIIKLLSTNKNDESFI